MWQQRQSVSVWWWFQDCTELRTFFALRCLHPQRSLCSYSRVPGHRNHVFDPASVFLSTHRWSQHPACQRCFGRAASGGALVQEPPCATGVRPEVLRSWLFWAFIFEVGVLPPNFQSFHLFWDRTSFFIVRSQIGGEYDLQTGIFGIATPWRRNKTLSDLEKKVGEKEKLGCPFSKKIREMRHKVRKNERKPN